MITFIQMLNESNDNATNDVESFIISELEKMFRELKKHETSDLKVPSAPDTTKFLANRSGKVNYVNGGVLRRGGGLLPINLKRSVHIGGAIDIKITGPLVKKFFSNIGKKFNIKTGTDYARIPASPNNVEIWYSSGTNYSTIGYHIR